MKHADPLTFVLIVTFIGLIVFYLWRTKRGKIPYVRKISGVAAIEEAVGRATEMGKPVVFAMGYDDIRGINTHVALAVMGYAARIAARYRVKFVALIRLPNVYPFAEETVREAYKAEGVVDAFNAEEQVLFLSEDGVVYAMAVARYIDENKAGCAIFLGAFGFTSLLMTEPGAQSGVIQIAGDPFLWQIPFFVCTCDHTIIGEEYFASGAYVSTDPTMRGTLVSQDLIKVVFAGLIILGTLCYHLDLPPARWIADLLTKY